MKTKSKALFHDSDFVMRTTLLMLDRYPAQVTERLDRLVAQIRDIQRPFMKGKQPADVVLARCPPNPRSLPSPC